MRVHVPSLMRERFSLGEGVHFPGDNFPGGHELKFVSASESEPEPEPETDADTLPDQICSPSEDEGLSEDDAVSGVDADTLPDQIWVPAWHRDRAGTSGSGELGCCLTNLAGRPRR